MAQNDENSLICICGTTFQQLLGKDCYSGTVICDLCEELINKDGKVYHCPSGKVAAHEHGYDLCTKCAANGDADSTTKLYAMFQEWMNEKGYKMSDIDGAITRMKNDGFNEVEIKALIYKRIKSDLAAEGTIEFMEDSQMNQKEIDYNLIWKQLLVFGFCRQLSRGDAYGLIPLDVVETIVCCFGFLFEIDSVVLTNDEKDILTRILMQNVLKKMKNQQKIRLKLIYRQSKETESFHSLCCDKSPLLFVFHSKFDHICGVFQNIPLTNKGGWKYDKHCFLFLLRSSFGHKPNVWTVTKDKNNIIGRYNVVRDGMGMKYPSWGSAGMGCGLSVSQSDSFCMNSTTFEYESGNALLGGSKHSRAFMDHRAGAIKEYEVYQIEIAP